MMDRLDEIRARCDAATPGPWAGWHKNTWKNTRWFSMDFGNYEGHIVEEKSQWSICSVHRDRDVDFIAHARDDIAYLLEKLALSKAREHPQNIFPELTPQERAANAEIVALTARAEKAEAERDTYKAALQNWHEPQKGE